jgi:hypothetical protein
MNFKKIHHRLLLSLTFAALSAFAVSGCAEIIDILADDEYYAGDESYYEDE